MATKAIVFDLDGTLLDSIEDIADATNHVLAARGYPIHATDKFYYFVGDGASMLIKRALPVEVREGEIFEQCFREYRETYGAGWNIKTRIYDGIAEVLDALTERDLTLTVLSNKPDRFTRQCVEHYFDRWPFPAVFGQREGIPRKPDPAGALEIARSLGVSPSECLFVGDTAVDILTGRAAGMKTAGVLWGYRPESELREAGADSVIASPAELIDCLGDVCE